MAIVKPERVPAVKYERMDSGSYRCTIGGIVAFIARWESQAVIWAAGAKACAEGKPRSAVPYRDTRSARVNRRSWLAGWTGMDRALRDRHG